MAEGLSLSAIAAKLDDEGHSTPARQAMESGSSSSRAGKGDLKRLFVTSGNVERNHS